MKKTLQRGFTLIELLVVIAIIGILAAVVLASLNDARQSGSDAAIQQSIGNARSQAEIVYNRDGAFSYDDVCTDPQVQQLMTAAQESSAATSNQYDLADDSSASTVTCHDSDTQWAIIAPLAASTTQSWCVDSSGQTGRVASDALAGGDLTCN